MHVNRTSEWKVIAIWISRELLLFNLERLDISWASIIQSSQNLWLFEFSESFLIQFLGSRYVMHLNWTSAWNIIAILNFSRASVSQFWASRYIVGVDHRYESKVMAVWIYRELSCSISKVSIYDARESNIRVKRYRQLNFSRASVVQFWASRYIIGTDHTFRSKVMVVRIFRELPCSTSTVYTY